MALYRFGDRKPEIGKGSWVSDSARVIGNVVIGEDCYIGHGAVLRGDYGDIRIGDGSAIEENATLHIRPGGTLDIGKAVTVGHGAILHCNKIGDNAVIGMGAVVSFDVEVGEWTIVAEGCVVPAGGEAPAGKIMVGVPAQVAGDVQPRHKEFWTYGKQLYQNLAHLYPGRYERID